MSFSRKGVLSRPKTKCTICKRRPARPNSEKCGNCAKVADEFTKQMAEHRASKG